MSTFTQLGEKMRAVYGRYSNGIDMAVKFLLALFSFFWIRGTLGFNPIFSNPFLLLVLAVLCMIFSLTAIPVFSALLIVGQSFSLGLDVGVVTLAIFLVILILFVRFIPEDALEVVLTPLTMFFGFAALVPICTGLKRKISAVFSVACGVVIYYLMATLSRESKNLKTLAASDYAERLQLVVRGTFSSTMVVNLLALMAVLVIVHAIRRLGFDYCMQAAIPVGGLVYLMFVLLGDAVLGTDIPIAAALIGTIGSVIAAWILLLFLLPLDYSKTEKMEFEDDDYYYYVKAIPKAAATKEEIRRLHPDLSEDDEPDDEDLDRVDLDEVNFEERLEDSLKNL